MILRLRRITYMRRRDGMFRMMRTIHSRKAEVYCVQPVLRAILCSMRIGVYGLGRFGSFWAGCLSAAGCEVIAYSRSEHPLPSGVKRASEEEVLSADYLFYCVAISSFEEVLKRTVPMIGENTVVMDTCSVKIYPRQWMIENVNPSNFMIAVHPMFGPDSGAHGLDGLPVVMCPVTTTEDPRYEKVRDLFKSMKLEVLEMSAEKHDEEAAYSQGVTHFVGRVLHEMGMKPTPIATQGYKSLMTIVEQTCNDPVQLFYDLQRYNPYAREMRLSLQVAIEKVINALRREEN